MSMVGAVSPKSVTCLLGCTVCTILTHVRQFTHNCHGTMADFSL